ncbi:MAG: hypothetical protein QXK06_05440 [Candidatus Diapherotrites archaeon]
MPLKPPGKRPEPGRKPEIYVRDRKRNPPGQENYYLRFRGEGDLVEALAEKRISRKGAKSLLRTLKKEGITFKTIRSFSVFGDSGGGCHGRLLELLSRPAMGGGTSQFKFVTDFRVSPDGKVELLSVRRHERWT